jgi:hypothetical protein
MQYECRELYNRQILIYPKDFFKRGPERQWLDLGVKNLWKICRLAYGFAYLLLPPHDQSARATRSADRSLNLRLPGRMAEGQETLSGEMHVHKMTAGEQMDNDTL